jgi:hypothetical protein
MNNRVQGCFTIAMIILALPASAAAYVDPGSGTMLWQLAAAAVFGGLFQIRRIVNWFRGRVPSAPTAQQKSDSTDRDGLS